MVSVLMKAIVNKIVDSGLANYTEIKGCSIDELNALEEYMGKQLPEVYRQFLLTMGKGAGLFGLGTDMFFKHIFNDGSRLLKEGLQELLEEENNSLVLPNNIFVFSSHQGYVYAYFCINGQDDPPVYQYVEGYKVPDESFSSFSTYLLELVDETIKSHMFNLEMAKRKKDNLLLNQQTQVQDIIVELKKLCK